LKQHLSQKDTHDSDEMLRQWAEEEGREKGLHYAETFRVMILQGDEDLPLE